MDLISTALPSELSAIHMLQTSDAQTASGIEISTHPNYLLLRFKSHPSPTFYNLTYNTQILKLVFLGNTGYTEERGRVPHHTVSAVYNI